MEISEEKYLVKVCAWHDARFSVAHIRPLDEERRNFWAKRYDSRLSLAPCRINDVISFEPSRDINSCVANTNYFIFELWNYFHTTLFHAFSKSLISNLIIDKHDFWKSFFFLTRNTIFSVTKFEGNSRLLNTPRRLRVNAKQPAWNHIRAVANVHVFPACTC